MLLGSSTFVERPGKAPTSLTARPGQRVGRLGLGFGATRIPLPPVTVCADSITSLNPLTPVPTDHL